MRTRPHTIVPWSSEHWEERGRRDAHHPGLRELRRDRLEAVALRTGHDPRGGAQASRRRLGHGHQTLDTADAYGGGRSESFIGEWLRDEGRRRARPRPDRHEDVQPRGGRRRSRPLAARGSAGRSVRAWSDWASSGSRSTWRTASTRTSRRRRRSQRSTSSSARASSTRSARQTLRPSRSPRPSSCPPAKG